MHVSFWLDRNRGPTDTDVIEKRVSPASQESKISCINNRKNLCDLMEVEPKPLIVANQSLVSAPPNDAFDAVLKGRGTVFSPPYTFMIYDATRHHDCFFMHRWTATMELELFR